MSKKPYVQRMAVFIVLVSLVSAYCVLPFGMFVGGVTPVLSFPFYSIWTRVEGSPVPPSGIPIFISTYKFYFLTTEIGYVATGNVGYLLSFSFFLLVNTVGAYLGYELGRIQRIRELTANEEWGFVGLILGLVFLGLGIWLYSIRITVHGIAFFLFGILALAIVVGTVIWRLLSKSWFFQNT